MRGVRSIDAGWSEKRNKALQYTVPLYTNSGATILLVSIYCLEFPIQGHVTD